MKKILVIQQKMIGDVLVSSIICNNLRREFPDARIDYMIYPFTAPVCENNPNIDQLVLFTDEIRTRKTELLKFLVRIRKSRYDIVIDAYGKLESCLITRFSGAKMRIGYKQKEKLFAYNVKVQHHDTPKSTDGLAIERRVNLFKGLMSGPIATLPHLFVTDTEKQQARELLEQHGIEPEKTNLVMLSVLGSDVSKTYPLRYFAQLIDRIAEEEENLSLLFNYMPKQRTEAEHLYGLCSEKAQKKMYLDVLGSDLRSFMGIMSHCKLLIGNDGGAVNMAKALEKPTFTIFSPWIQKESWSIFEDGEFHQAVHLNDFLPELIGGKSRKYLRKNVDGLYEKFSPSFIFSALDGFLNRHLRKHV